MTEVIGSNRDLLKKKIRYLEVEKRNVETERYKLEKKVTELERELKRLRSPPLITAVVLDVLNDGRLVVKSSSGPDFVVSTTGVIDKDIYPGTQVALNQRTLAVMEVLPSSKDPAISGMEIVTSPDVTYAHIGGLRTQIRDVKETVELPLKEPKKFEKIGIDPPNGVLFHGPPGCGKTLLAKAVANETDATFIRVVASEFVKKYIGEGAKLVRSIFKLGREKAPSIIFIDEIDAIGAKRTDSSISGDREVQRTLMQFLSELDGFNPRGDIKVIAATNRVDILDEALLRSGRFDRKIEIPLPDREARETILKIHSAKMNTKNVNLGRIAGETKGLSGADLKTICMEAGMRVIRDEREFIGEEDFRNVLIKNRESPKEKSSMYG
ncbi:MAG: proteasome-activating nucleotidase [Euryarchaeota archaeon]|nr:proteasome-activating nucleotidase [Euryarchaeota archaeon]